MKELIKERIENRSITQKELAEKAGISETHLSLILKGERELSYEIAEKIYSELGYISPIILIEEYFNIKSSESENPDYILTEDNPLTETVGKLILTHFKNNDLSSLEKAIFIMKVTQFGEYILEENAENSFEKLVKE